MADKTQINLERIRACDAEWDESKHKRADNGQFTSGGGATVIKAQSGGKAKVQQLKNVSSALAGVNAGIEKAKKTAASQLKSNMARGEKLKADVDKDIQNLWDNHQKDWRYSHAYGRLKNKPGMESLAERVKEKGKGLMKEYSDKYDKLMQKKRDINEEYGPDGRRDDLRRKNYEKTMNQLYPQKQALEAEQKKFQAAKATLEKGRPQIAATRKLAKAAQPAPKPQPKAAKPEKSIEQLENEYKDAFNRYVAFTENAKGLHDLYRNPEIYKQAMQMAKQKAIKAEKAYMKASEKQEKQAKPAAESAATLQKARPKIEAARKYAKTQGAAASGQKMDDLTKKYIQQGKNDHAMVAMMLKSEMYMADGNFHKAVGALQQKINDPGLGFDEDRQKNLSDILLNDVSGDAFDAVFNELKK